MTRIKPFAVVLLFAVMLPLPSFAARGKADFTRFVAIGDSYGAGFESASLNQSHQPFSWPAVIARQVGLPICAATAAATDVCFAEPLVTFPGIPNEIQLVDVIRYPPTLSLAPGQGQPLMNTFGRPFNNLSVPGATVSDVITIKGNENPPQGTAQQYASFILRGLGTEVQQALAQQPTFVAIWIGGNDALGAVLDGTPAELTPVDAFRTAYNSMLDQLIAGAPGAGMVVGTIPNNPVSLPFAATIPRFLIDPNTRQPVLISGQPVPLIADLGGGNFGPLPAGSFVLLTAASKLQTGFGIPSALAAFPPFNQLPDVGKPLDDKYVLTPTEVQTIVQRVNDFNTVITTAAAAHDIPVADIKGLFDRVASGTYFVGPINLTSAFITGGFFSLDGFHLTDMGYTLFADEYIKTINGGYGTRIPLAGLWQFLQNNDTVIRMSSGAPVFEGMSYEIDAAAADQMKMFAPTIVRRRLSVGH
jgi:lysophospholipase L1-like esterase